MTKRHLIAMMLAMFVTLVIASCATPQKRATATNDFAWVSIIRLIAEPGEYNGQNVQVEGYFIYERQGTSDIGYLFLDRTSYTYQITKNALAVKIPNDLISVANQLDGKYVILDGTFDRTYLGPWSLYAAGVKLHGMRASVVRGPPRPAPDSQ